MISCGLLWTVAVVRVGFGGAVLSVGGGGRVIENGVGVLTRGEGVGVTLSVMAWDRVW